MRAFIRVKALSLTAIFLCAGGMLLAQDNTVPAGQQKLKGWSIGIRGLHLYDLPVSRYDTELSRDPKGLYGDNTSVDFGLEGYIEKQFTPFLGLQTGYRWGKMTGANETEYYKNSLYSLYGDLVFDLSNIDRRRGNRRLGIYAKAGLGWGRFDAERYLASDDSPNGSVADAFWTGRLGGGIRYRITDYLRAELDAVYNLAYHDGFDGYNNATGNNPYLSTGLGIAYTIGGARVKPMYGVNFFGTEYFGIPEAQPQPQVVNEPLLAEHAGFRDQLVRLQQQVALLEQELRSVQVPVAAAPPAPVTVFFEVSSAQLSRDAKRRLAEALEGADAPALTITAYADHTGTAAFNQHLKESRAAAVSQFVSGLGYKGSISVVVGATQAVTRDNFLSRKVVISFE